MEAQWETEGVCVSIYTLALHSSHSVCVDCVPPVGEFPLPVATSAEIPQLDAQE